MSALSGDDATASIKYPCRSISFSYLSRACGYDCCFQSFLSEAQPPPSSSSNVAVSKPQRSSCKYQSITDRHARLLHDRESSLVPNCCQTAFHAFDRGNPADDMHQHALAQGQAHSDNNLWLLSNCLLPTCVSKESQAFNK